MLTTPLPLRNLSLTATCLSLLFITLTTTHAQTRAYVADSCDNTVAVIDTRTNTIVDAIPVGSQPQFVAVTPDAKRVYVSNRFGNSVSVIDTATNTVISTIPVNSPAGIAISPDGTRVYVASVFGSAIVVIDTSTNAVLSTIPDRPFPFQLVITGDGERLYVTHGEISLGRTVSVIDIANKFVILSRVLVLSPGGIAITPDSTRVYVMSRGGLVEVIDTLTLNVIDFISVDQGVNIAIAPDGTRAYTASFFNNVNVIDTLTNTVVAIIPINNSAVFPAVTPDGARLYVSTRDRDIFGIGTVAVIDTETNALITVIQDLMCPMGIAISPPQFPQSKGDCKDGGYQRFGPPAFRNQGQCIKYVKDHVK